MITVKTAKGTKKFKRIKFLLQYLSNGSVKGEIDQSVIDTYAYKQAINRIVKTNNERMYRVIINDRNKKRHKK